MADAAGWYGDDLAHGSRLTGMPPTRLVDTRNGTGAPVARLGPGGTLAVQVTNREGIPATGVSAVVLNVTAVDATAAQGYVTVWPDGLDRPLASNLNVSTGRTVPNLVLAKVGAGGLVDVYNAAGLVDIVVDVTGWYGAEGAAGGSRYAPVSPTRIVDTRDGTGAPGAVAVGPGGVLAVQVTGRGGVPVSDVAAVALNVTVVDPTGSGYLTVWPAGSARPLASNLNFTAARTVANMVVVAVGAGGVVDLFNSVGASNIVVDVAGWFGA